MKIALSLASTALLCVTASTLSAQILDLDRDVPLSGKTVTVRNGNKLTITLRNKDPFDTCTFDGKREVIAEGDGVAAMVGLIGGAASALNLVRSVTPISEPLRPSAAPGVVVDPLLPTLEKNIAANLKELLTRSEKARSDVALIHASVGKATKASSGFLKKRFRNGEPAFENERLSVVAANTAASALLSLERLPSLSAYQSIYENTILLMRRYQLIAGSDPNFVAGILGELDLTRANLDALSAALDKLKAAGSKLSDLTEYFEKIKEPQWTFTKTLNSDQNAKITGSVGCVNTLTKVQTLDPIYFVVSFIGPPQFSVSVGALVSALAEERVAPGSVVTQRTGAATSFAAEIQKSSVRPQVIPMSLMQIRLGSGTLRKNRFDTWNFTPGIGVNPRNKEAEFFFGLSRGWGNLYISGGAHIGHQERPAGNFQIGDRPTAALASVPTSRPWAAGFSVGISYRLPLK